MGFPKQIFYKLLPKKILDKLKRARMEPSKEIIEFIKSYEQIHDGDLNMVGLQPKLDARGIWTEGYGHAMVRGREFMTSNKYPTLDSIIPFSVIHTEEQALKLLAQDIKSFAEGVRSRLKVEVNQHQFDALVSHSFNCGFSATLYSLINNNSSEKAIKNWFTTRYITAGGTYLKGLQYRRNDEYQIWAGINYKREANISV